VPNSRESRATNLMFKLIVLLSLVVPTPLFIQSGGVNGCKKLKKEVKPAPVWRNGGPDYVCSSGNTAYIIDVAPC